MREMDEIGALDFYLELLEAGQSPNMAAMLAAQSPPGLKGTDTQFSRKENERMRDIDDVNMQNMLRIAKRAGINTHGKTYNGQLGKYDDPRAWVSDLSDVKETAMHKQMDIDGDIKVNGYRGPKKKKPRIAGDILDGLEARERKNDKALDNKCKKDKNSRRELRQKLVEKHSKKK